MKQIIDIVILYANEEEVFAYANALSKQTVADDIVLVIVVNKKGTMPLESLKARLSALPLSIFIFDPDKNLGYLNGVIYGYNQYCKLKFHKANWVIVSNTDIEFSDDRFFEKFLYAEYEDDIWCVAPSVYSPKKGSYDNPEYVERCRKSKIDKLIFIYERPLLAYTHMKLAKLRGRVQRSEKKDSQFIYSGKGCFLIIRDQLAEILKDKEYKALMYSEESYIAEIIKAYNRKTYYDSKIEVIHKENAVTGKIAGRKRAKYIADSLKVIRDEFYNDN